MYPKGRSLDGKEPTSSDDTTKAAEEANGGVRELEDCPGSADYKRVESGPLRNTLMMRLKIQGKQKGNAHLVATECTECGFLACEQCAQRLQKASAVEV